MNRKELISAVSKQMRAEDRRKPVSVPKTTLRITDDNGITRTFSVRGSDKSVLYNSEDVEAVLDTCLEVIKEALRNGESIDIRGFGCLCLRYFKRKMSRNPQGEGYVEIKAKYVPKFTTGVELKRCAAVYAAKVADKINEDLPVDNFNFGEIDEDSEDGDA